MRVAGKRTKVLTIALNDRFMAEGSEERGDSTSALHAHLQEKTFPVASCCERTDRELLRDFLVR